VARCQHQGRQPGPPGTAVEPGEYTCSAIRHKGIGLRLRGWAYHGPSDPWDNGPTTYWGGDQALPVDCVADDEKVYLGWAGSEAGKAVVACGLDDDVQWAAGYHFNGVIRMALDGDMLYYVNDARLKRVSIKNGKPVNWPGADSATLEITTFWEGREGMPSRLNHNTEGMASRDGKLLRTIAKKAGRTAKGPWDPNSLSAPWGMVIDARGRLWVAETEVVPKRFSIWNPKTGEFIKEYLGPTHYGGSGGMINPRDPNLMAGEGCEFRIDPKTGRAKLLGIITMGVYQGCSRFCEGANGKLYLAGSYRGHIWGGAEPHQIKTWERLGDGDYAYRAVIRQEGKETIFWADENGDEEEQPEEVASLPVSYGIGGYYLWSVAINTDLTFYGAHKEKGVQIKVGGFTKCGAPKYDLENIKELPPISGGALSSPDNRLVVSCDSDGSESFRCYEVQTGKLLWTYPNRWHGVHGSHRAPGPAVGLIRGAYGFVGNAEMPEPIGALWVINTNVGEWHVLTEDGYYLTRLFQGDSNKRKWPEKAVPGAVMDNCPSGRGGEDFGGSMTQGKDGKIYIEAGKLALWNLEVVGLENVKEIRGGNVTVTPDDALRAEIIRGQGLQAVAEAKSTAVKKLTPNFTGNLNGDFKGAKLVDYSKEKDASVRSVAAWDDANLRGRLPPASARPAHPSNPPAPSDRSDLSDSPAPSDSRMCRGSPFGV
jgi:hypothetical protein